MNLECFKRASVRGAIGSFSAIAAKMLLGAVAATILAFAPAKATQAPVIGVNVSGAEYSWMPFASASDLDYLAGKGITLIRLPISWERMQPTVNGPLNETYLTGLRTLLDRAAARRIKVLIDLHNYGRYNFDYAAKAAANYGIVSSTDPEATPIGTSRLPISSFASFWGKLAARLTGHAGIAGYDIMNEPYFMPSPTVWPQAAQAAVNAIRAVDMNTPIYVEGDQWASASMWKQFNSNLHINDPANKIIYEAHAYFDSDGSGRYQKTYDQQGATPNTGIEHVQPFLDWLRENNYQGFLGEFGVPANTDPKWIPVLNNVLKAVQEAGVSATYWNYVYSDPSGANSWWPVADPMSISPSKNWGSLQMQSIFARNSPTINGFSPDTGVVGDGATTFDVITIEGMAGPRASVRVYEGSTPLGAASADAGGAWSFTTGQLSSRQHSFTATVTDTAGTVSQASLPLIVTVASEPSFLTTTVGVVSSANPSTLGASTVFTATVASATGSPSGTVAFKDGAVTLGVGTLSGGVATFSTSSLAAGQHAITAVYDGDAKFTSSTSSALSQTVNKGATTTLLSGPQYPTTPGQTATFVATVAAVVSGVGTPSGTVTFKDGAATLGSGVVAGGVATFSISSLSAGQHTITAVYGGDTKFTASASSGLIQTVNKGSTTTTIGATPNPATPGQPATFTATVTASASATGTPDGIVTFKDGATSLGTRTLSGGVATLSTSSLSVGQHAITAVYDGDTKFTASASSGLTQTINKGPTTTTVSATPNPATPGQPVTFTATVAASASATGTPGGTVTFKDGAVSLGTRPLSSGSATLSISSLSAGQHVITVIYDGDAKFTASASSGLTQTVNKGATTTTVSATPNPATPGQPVIFTATVAASASATGTPGGTVTFKDGAVSLGTRTLSSGSATLSISSLSAGQHVITVVYDGDTKFTASTSAGLTQTINKGATTTTVSATPNPATPGQPVTFTATVSASVSIENPPSGVVTFRDGAVTLGTGSLLDGIATLSTSSLSTGQHIITAIYDGDNKFTASTSSGLTQEIEKAATTTTVSATPNPATPGQSVTFTATVAASVSTENPPGGVVTFKDGAVILGTGSLSDGTTTLSTASLPAGQHIITAIYDGDAKFAASTSSGLTQKIESGATTTSVSSTPNPSKPGQSATFTATVIANVSTENPPSGVVTFKDGAVTLGTGSLSDGTATFSTSSLSAGRHTITAIYGGDTNFPESTSAELAHTVGKVATATSITARPNPSRPGQLITFTATVAAPTSTATLPTGKVVFKNGGIILGTGTVVGGRATLGTTLTAGRHKVTASYSGTSVLEDSASALALAVDARIGPEFLVNTYTTGSQQNSAVANLNGSGFVVVWTSRGQDGSGVGIYGQRYSSTGARTGGEFRVNTETAASQTAPSVAGLSDGGFAVTWESSRQDGAGYGTYGQRYSKAGTKLGGEFRINTTVAKDQSLPSIAGLDTGGFVVAWQSESQDGSGLGVYGQRYDKAAKTVGREFKINTTTTKAQSKPSIAALAEGGFVIVWQSNGQDGSGFGIYGQRYGSDGKGVGREFRINKEKEDTQSLSSVAGLKNGGFVVVWESRDQDSSGLGVFGQRYTEAGDKVGGEFRVNTTVSKHQREPSVAPSPGGGFVVAWSSAGQDGSGHGVYAQAYDDRGRPLDTEFRVNTTIRNNQWHPSVAAFSDGDLVVTWTSRDQDGSLEGVYGQRFKLMDVEPTAASQFAFR